MLPYLTLIITLRLLRASILASSSIESCFSSEEGSDCSKKLFLSLAIENGQLKGTETAQFTFGNFTDASRVVVSLESPLELTISKSQVKVIYKLKYIQSFVSQVFEKVMNSVWPFCTEGLITGDQLSVDSTCGYAKDANNTLVNYSQGFCCTCPMTTLLTGIKTETTRGSCGFFSSSQTGHCLRFGNTTYAGYTIEGYSYNYDIKFDMSYKLGNSTSYETQSQVLSTSRRTETNSFFTAKIVGDYLPLDAPPDLSSKMLLIPSAQLNSTVTGNWLVVDRGMVTLDGNECNKIGVSYPAFQNQNNRCGVDAATCLNNQIDDILVAEKNRQAAGVPPRYLLSGFGSFNKLSKDDKTITLDMDYNQIFTTNISIEIAADGLTFTTQLGKASIESIQISDFEAMKGLGKLTASIKNKSSYNAEFGVVLICSTYIQPVLQKTIPLVGGNSATVEFDLQSTSADAQANTCRLDVTNAKGIVVASQSVAFNTTKLNEVTSNTGSTSDDKVITGTDDQDKVTFDSINQQIICMYLCPTISSAACFVVFGCANEIKRMVYYILGTLMIILATLLGVYKCCGPKIFFCFSCFFKKQTASERKQLQLKDPKDIEAIKISPFTLEVNSNNAETTNRVRMDLLRIHKPYPSYSLPDVGEMAPEYMVTEASEDADFNPVCLRFNQATVYVKYGIETDASKAYQTGMRKTRRGEMEFLMNRELETALREMVYVNTQDYSRIVDQFLKQNLLEIAFN